MTPAVRASRLRYLCLRQRRLISAWLTGTTDTSATFTGQIGHTYAFYSIATDNVGNAEAAPATADTQTQVGVPPTVTGVLVCGSAWSGSFLDYLNSQGLGDAIMGYSIPSGASQLTTLPWSNLDTITITFSQDVNVTQGDLQALGVTVTNYMISDFNYNSSIHAATWTLQQPVATDKILIDLTGVTDQAGIALDGEWTNGISTFPSGNGTAGGDFQFRLNVLPGDVTQDGMVISNDGVMVRNALGTTAGMPGYSVFLDVTADGMVISNDRIIVRNQLGVQLPDGEPVVPQSLVASGTSQAIAAAETPPNPPATEQITTIEEGPTLTEISETNTVIVAPIVAEQTTSTEESSAITETTASVPVIASSTTEQMSPTEETPSIIELPEADPVATTPTAQTQTVLQTVNAATATTTAVLEDNNLPTSASSQTETFVIDESNPVAVSTVPPLPSLLSSISAIANPIPAPMVGQLQSNLSIERTPTLSTLSTSPSISTNLNVLSPWTLYPFATDRAISDLNGSRLESFGTLDQTLESGRLTSEQSQLPKSDFSMQLRTHLVQQVFKTMQKDKATEISDRFSPGFTMGLSESKNSIETLDESLMQISDELEESFTNLAKVPVKLGIHRRGESNRIIA